MIKTGVILVLIICSTSADDGTDTSYWNYLNDVSLKIREAADSFIDSVRIKVQEAADFGHEVHCFVDHAYCDKVKLYPPSVTCGKLVTVTAPPKSTEAKVFWKPPTASDKEDGSLTPIPHGGNPGESFTEGAHSVVYTATDSDQQTGTCTQEILVIVVRCSQNAGILHGTHTCTTTKGQTLLGDSCSFTCSTGYYMTGSAKSICTNSSHFTDNPVCNPVQCPSPPVFPNGKYNCKGNKHYYSDTCPLNCSSGYRPGKGTQYIRCQANKTWTDGAKCIENNNPPNITCEPQPKTVIAPPGLTKAVVSYELPHVIDHEDGILKPLTDGLGPGATFPEGVTYVKYTATDSEGIKAECEKVISVKVIRCSEPSDVLHGTKSCKGLGTGLLGDTCSFTCNSGYNLTGHSTVKCSMQKQFEPQIPTCEPLPCPNPPALSNAILDCSNNTHHHYGDVCYLNCSDGYRPGKGNMYTSCLANQTWSQSAPCIDNTPPTFDNCPLNITLFSDRGTNYTNATWPKITASDPPTGRPATVILNSPEPWGTYFEEGEHLVEYHAYDDAGNRAVIPCSFTVTVETIRCPVPNLHPNDTQHLMLYGCKEYIYGTVCPVSCQSGYPLGGPDHIVCEKDGSFPPVASWKWNETSGITPYCMVRPCLNLTAPANGALVCDKWMHGRMCQMQCNSKFNFPVTAPSDGMFVCGTATGKWRPSGNVPDCVAYAGFSTMRMKSYFYYNGSCPGNPGVQKQIKENFIKALKSSFYGFESCTNVKACQPENVQVICGRVTRDSHRRDSTDSVTFKFDVVVAYDESKGSGPAALGLNDQRLHKIADSLKKVAQNGSLNLDQFGLKVDKVDVKPEAASLDCPEGRMADMSKGSCVGCSKGTYLDSSSKTCVDCPVGTYQEQDASASCIQCPRGMSTATTGSVNRADCREICQPGFISPDGLKPCNPCPLGTFQSMPRNQHCVACPQGMTTRISASTDIEECLDFDLSLDENSVAVFKPLSRPLDKLTFALWLFLYKEVVEPFSFVTWQEITTGITSLKMDMADAIQINIRGVVAVTSIKIPARKWTHLAAQLDANTGSISLFVNGQLSARQTMQMPKALVLGGHNLIVRSNNAVAVFSRMILFDDVVPSQTISSLAESCLTMDSPHLMDMTDVDMALSDGAQFVIPSVCGEFLQ